MGKFLKAEPLTKEQRKFFIHNRYIEYDFEKDNGEIGVAEYYECRILKESDDDMYKGRKSTTYPLMYGNSLILRVIAPEDVFMDEESQYCISRDSVPFYHVSVTLANGGYSTTDLWTANLMDAVNYYDKLEKFFQLTPKPAILDTDK